MDPRYKREARRRRHARARKRLRGTPERPRLSVYRSNVAIYAQVIDDLAGHTIAAASSLDNALAPDAGGNGDQGGPGGVGGNNHGKASVARAVGRLVAERARERGVEVVVFDRGGNRYHGRVRALAEGAREAGLRL